MVVTQTANQPITFGGQIVAYGAGVANTEQSRFITQTANTPIRFTNSQGTVQYTSLGGNPTQYTTS